MRDEFPPRGVTGRLKERANKTRMQTMAKADRCLSMEGQARQEVPHYALAAHGTVPFGRTLHCRAPRCIRCAQIGNGLPCLAAAHRQARSGMSQCSDCAPLVIAGQDATVRQRAIRGSAEVCPGLMYEWSLVSD